MNMKYELIPLDFDHIRDIGIYGPTWYMKLPESGKYAHMVLGIVFIIDH